MNGDAAQPPHLGADAEQTMDAAAQQLREEMETALRHLRHRIWGAGAAPGPGAAEGGRGAGEQGDRD